MHQFSLSVEHWMDTWLGFIPWPWWVELQEMWTCTYFFNRLVLLSWCVFLGVGQPRPIAVGSLALWGPDFRIISFSDHRFTLPSQWAAGILAPQPHQHLLSLLFLNSIQLPHCHLKLLFLNSDVTHLFKLAIGVSLWNVCLKSLPCISIFVFYWVALVPCVFQILAICQEYNFQTLSPVLLLVSSLCWLFLCLEQKVFSLMKSPLSNFCSISWAFVVWFKTSSHILISWSISSVLASGSFWMGSLTWGLESMLSWLLCKVGGRCLASAFCRGNLIFPARLLKRLENF